MTSAIRSGAGVVPGQRRPSDERPTRIVVGVDSSVWGLRALAWALRQARLSGTDLEVRAALSGDLPDPVVGRRIDEIRRAMPNRAVPVLPSGDPAALLAESGRAGMVVLGCRGTGHPHLGLGSGVPGVAAAAACDVVVVRGDPVALSGAHGRVTAVLGGPGDDEAVASARRLAAVRGARLSVLRHRPPIGRGPSREDTAVAADVVTGDPSEVFGRLPGTDVVVVGVRGRLDALARAALYHARCPVLLAHARRQ